MTVHHTRQPYITPSSPLPPGTSTASPFHATPLRFTAICHAAHQSYAAQDASTDAPVRCLTLLRLNQVTGPPTHSAGMPERQTPSSPRPLFLVQAPHRQAPHCQGGGPGYYTYFQGLYRVYIVTTTVQAVTWSLRMRSSMVPAMMKRCTAIGLNWPSLWILSCACCSTAGFHLRSIHDRFHHSSYTSASGLGV